MNVSFTDKDQFLQELSGSTAGTVVRCAVEREEENAGVTKVTLVSGYYDSGSFHELRLFCGEDWQGGTVQEGSEKAKAVEQEIRDACEESGLIAKGGKWQAPSM